jgi:outer membrane receptor protein involved in Fe transport
LLAIAAAGSVAAQSDGELDTIVVRAQKRAAVVQEVPVAVSALSGEQLRIAGVINADDLAAALTTFDLKRSFGLSTTSLRIRRVGNIGNIPTFEPAVGVFVDGAFRSRSFLGASSLLAVDHVEVLRGPQSVLYGKNVSAGLLAVYTRMPGAELALDTEITGGRVDSPGRANAYRAGFDLSGPLGPTLGGGLAGRLERQDATLLNALPGGPDGNDLHRTALRGQVSWSAGEAFELRLLSGYLREKDNQGESDVFLDPGAGSTAVAGLLQTLGLIPDCPDNVPRNRTVCSVATNTVDLEAVDVTLLADYRFANEWLLKSMTSWDRYEVFRTEEDAIQLFAPMLFYRDPELGRSFQQEFQLQSADREDFNWLLGGFYYRNDFVRGDRGRQPMFGVNGDLAYDPIWPILLGGLPLAVPGQLGVHDSELDTRYLSVFGEVSWQLAPQFWLTAGLRWQEEDKRARLANSVTVPGASLISLVLTPAVTLQGAPVNGTLDRTSRDVPWSLTPQYRFSDDAMAYFTVARGSKSGGFNTGFGDAPLAEREFDDEDIRHFELGAKLTLADRFVINAAAFHTEYDDYQDAAFISAQFSVGNAERVELRGVEVEGTAALSDRLTMDIAASWADLRYAVNTRGLCHPGRTPDGSRPGTCTLSGERPIQAPEWETHLGLTYRRPTTWGGLSARVDWAWTDDYNTSFSADPRLTQPAYSLISVRATAQIGKACEVTLWGDNLLDETASDLDSLLNLFNDASYQSYLSPPRSYGLTLRFRY